MTDSFVNTRGNTVKTWSADADRYQYDVRCTEAKGWCQYDTENDAWYFGVWVHVAKRLVVTYAEGDVSCVHCTSPESLQAELASMAEFYGDPPPAAIAIDWDGSVTHFYDARPTGESA